MPWRQPIFNGIKRGCGHGGHQLPARSKENGLSLLKWEAKYVMGVAEIDNQHKKWRDILNRFYDGVSKGD